MTDAEALAANLGIDLATCADRAGPPGPGRHAGPAPGRRADRPDRREPAEPDPGRAPHGAVQRPRVDRADHREQERDGHRLLHPLRRLGRRVRRHQGRGQDPRLRAVPLPQRPGRDRRSIPESVLDKPPSAELRPDQRDDESLPPYEVLDPVMAGYVEGDRSADDLVAEGFDPDAVARVVGLVDRAEYKRRQMPPGVRISGKAFGKDRRMPITNHYRSGARPPTAAARLRRAPVRCLTSPPGPAVDGTARDAGGRPLPLETTAALVGRVPLDRDGALRHPRRLGRRHAAGRGAGPPRRAEHAARLARRAVRRPAAGAGRGRPRRG